jgi:Phage derived protein Gp49-like (DUF891)
MVDAKISWTFFGYVTAVGGRDVQEWFDGLLEAEKDEAHDNLVYLQSLPFHLWNRPEFSPLGGGLSEIRFKVNSLNKTFRIYGCCWPIGKRYSYTLLLGTEKKVNNPRNDIKEAKKRKKYLEEKRASVYEVKF